MLAESQVVRISKLLSLALRHSPNIINISLDEHGWVSVERLLTALNHHGWDVNKHDLDLIVQANIKKRFAFNVTKNLIRASQGHSIDVNLEFQRMKPPEFLFHGTTVKYVESILRGGILRGKRLYVHLSHDVHTAFEVGMRKGEPIVLRIFAKKMYDEGFDFYLSDNDIWLSNAIPPCYIECP